MGKIFLIFIVLFLTIPFVIAEFEFDNPDLPQVTREEPTAITFNNNTGNVNSSNFWDNLDTVSDILGSLINNDLGWITSIITGDLTVEGDVNAFNVNASNITGILGNFTNISVDHIAEKTTGHNIVFDSEAEILNLLSVGDNEVRRGQIYFSNEAGQPALWIQGFSGGKAEIKTTSGADRIIKIYNTQVGKKLSLDLDDGDLTTTGNFTGNQIYGEMWHHSHAGETLGFVSDGVYYNLTFDNSLVNGFIFNNATDNLEVVYSGVYKTCYSASGSGQNNHVYFTDVTVNGLVIDKCESHKKMSAGGDIVTMSSCCFVNLNIGDEVKLATADIGGTGTGNYYSANLNLLRIGN